MTSEKKDYYGKEVADAIKKACTELKVPQEDLEIEVVETGSTGIFGLIRKKAHIKAYLRDRQPEVDEKEEEIAEPDQDLVAEIKSELETPENKKPEPVEPALEPVEPAPEQDKGRKSDIDITEVQESVEEKIEEMSGESLEQIGTELRHLLDLMGYPSSVEVTASGTAVTCKVGEEFEEALTGQDGKTLDSIQYILRKVVSRKILNRIRLTVDVGNFREKRLEELKVRAVELGAKVKADGKTQVISALSPSERRVVHMSLQDDKEIRSRSVGDGLFKKILIYKPGKGSKGGGRKRSNYRGRKGNNSRKKSE